MTTIAFVHFPSNRVYMVSDKRMTTSSGWLFNAPQNKKWSTATGYALATCGDMGINQAIQDVLPAVADELTAARNQQTHFIPSSEVFKTFLKHLNDHAVFNFQSPSALEDEGNKSLLFVDEDMTVHRLTIDKTNGSAVSHGFTLNTFDFVVTGSGSVPFEAAIKTASWVLFPSDNRLLEDSKKLTPQVEAGILKHILEVTASLDLYTSPECDIVLVSDNSEQQETGVN